MADTMIERIRDTLIDHSEVRMIADPERPHLPRVRRVVPYEMLTPERREHYDRVARAVLAAMREPTEAMTRAGVLAPNHLEDQSSPRGFNNMWRASIDAALSEEA